MDAQLSAFEIYRKQNKKKRKLSSDKEDEKKKHKPPAEPKLTSPFKKQKKIDKEIRINGKGSVALLKKPSPLRKKKLKIISKQGKKSAKDSVKLKNESSDDDIPTLIPIDTVNYKSKPAIQSAKKTSSLKSESSFINGGSVKSKSIKSIKNSTSTLQSEGELSVFNPVTQGLAVFKWLIDPTSPKEFFAKYWEREVLHISRSDRKYFDDVFSSEKLDSILREYPLHFTRNVDVVAYQNGKKEVIEEEGRALPSKLWDFYNNGCSVRILNPQTYDQNVHSIVSSLQEYFGTMVGTNVYLTPPSSQGFAPHFDDIEAFIVQLEGSKYWKLYKPKDEDVLARDSSPNFKPEDLNAPFMEVKLNAGDLLYFPRGTIHEGHTEEEHSLHITVSVYQHTAYADLLEQALPAALQKACRENIEFRKGLPLNYLKHVGAVNKNDKSNKRKIIIDKVKSLVENLIDYIDVDSAADNLGRKFMHDAMPPLYSKEEAQHSCKFDGDYMKNGKVFNRVEIIPEIKIRLLRYYALRVVQESEQTSKIFFCTDNAKTYHGEEEQWLEIDNSFIPGIEMLQRVYPEFVEADSLPMKDEAEKLGLVSSLWEHGLLVTDGPLPRCDDDPDSDANSSDSDDSINNSVD